MNLATCVDNELGRLFVERDVEVGTCMEREHYKYCRRYTADESGKERMNGEEVELNNM